MFNNTIQVQKSVCSVGTAVSKTGKFVATTSVFGERFPWRNPYRRRQSGFRLRTERKRYAVAGDRTRLDGWNDWLATVLRPPCLRKHGRDKPNDGKTLAFIYAEYVIYGGVCHGRRTVWISCIVFDPTPLAFRFSRRNKRVRALQIDGGHVLLLYARFHRPPVSPYRFHYAPSTYISSESIQKFPI